MPAEAGGGAETFEAGGAGGGSSFNEVATPTKRRPRSSKLHVNHGSLTVKVYPVNEDALDSLATLNRDATVLLSLASGAFGFAVDVTKDLFLTSGAPAHQIAFMAGINVASWVAAVVLAILGVRKWTERGNKLRDIKSSAVFASDAD